MWATKMRVEMAVPGPGVMAARVTGCCRCDEGELDVLLSGPRQHAAR